MVIAGMKKSQKTITELCKYIVYLTLAHTLNWVRSEGDLGGGRGTDFVIMAPGRLGRVDMC